MLTLGNIYASMTSRSFARIGVHEALILVLRLIDAFVAGHRVDRDERLVQSLVEIGDDCL